MDLHLSSIQLEIFSPLAQARCALPGGEGKRDRGRGWGPRKEVNGHKRGQLNLKRGL